MTRSATPHVDELVRDLHELLEDFADVALVLRWVSDCVRAHQRLAVDLDLGALLRERARAFDRRVEQETALLDDVDEIYERGIARPNGHVGLKHWAELTYQRALEAGPQPGDTWEAPPPPKAKPRHLTARELARVLELAEERSGALEGEGAFRALGLFLAEILPRLKYAAQLGPEEIPFAESAWRTAEQLGHAYAGEFETDALRHGAAVFEQIREAGRYGGARWPATWRLIPNAFHFEDVAPDEPVHLRTGGPRNLERRWESLQRAARGEDGRKF